MLVGPPSFHSVTWWYSHQRAGVWHPGMMQVRSRSAIARRWVALKIRSVIVVASTRPFLPVMTR